MGLEGLRVRSSLVLSAMLATVTAGPAAAQSAEARALAEQFAGRDWSHRPGCAVAAFRDGAVDYYGAFGLANVEFSAPITRSTVFNVGSVSKQFTAFAAVLLANRGALDLGRDIRTYVPWMPDYGTPITVRHLLTHTSGLRDYHTLWQLQGLTEDTPWTDEDARTLIASQHALNFTPGAEYSYSNTGYFLLGQIVEAVSGKSLAAFAHDEIFEPLGMHDTRFRDDHTSVVANRAESYTPDGSGGYRRTDWDQDIVGAGGLLTTVDDMLKWDTNLSTNPLGVRKDLFDEMATAATLTDGKSAPYGFGLMLMSMRGLPLVWHNGSTAGYNAVHMRSPEYHVSGLTLCNSPDGEGGRYMQAILDTYFASHMEPAPTPPANRGATSGPNAAAPEPWKPTPAELAALAGTYHGDEVATTYEIAAADGGITFRRVGPNGETFTLTPESQGVFRSSDRSFTLEFVREGGATRALFSTRSGRVRKLVFERTGSD